jgi:hypothetical protein
LLSETFRRAGSAEAVVRHFARQGILWPRRLATGPRAGELVFVPLEQVRCRRVDGVVVTVAIVVAAAVFVSQTAKMLPSVSRSWANQPMPGT